LIFSKSKHVIVLGAGLAGLSAAQHLVQGGCRVTLLESQDRVGGRAFSMDRPLAVGLCAETGPARFPADFFRVLALARRFGLELEPFYPETGSIVGLIRGQRIVGYVPDEEQFWGYGLQSSRLRTILWRLRGRLPQRMYHLRGGTHQLPIAMASALRAEILLRSEVTAVDQQPSSVRVNYRSPSGDKILEADSVVCALPLSVIPQISFEPALSPEKRQLIGSIPEMPAVRVFLQMRRPFWWDDGLNGFAYSDKIGEVWAPDFAAPQEPSMLVCYAHREIAEALCAMDESTRIEYVKEELEKILPGTAQHFERAASYSWTDQDWIRGAWPMVRHGFRKQIPLLQARHARVFFAGDYAASPRFLNMTEGALESGEHAARELLGLKS